MPQIIKITDWQPLGAESGRAGSYRMFGEYQGGGFYADFESEWRGGDDWDVQIINSNYVGEWGDLKPTALRIVASM